MSQTQQPPDSEQDDRTVEEKVEEWVTTEPGPDRDLEVSGTINLGSSIRVPLDATEEEKREALLAQAFIGEIDDVEGVTVWRQSHIDTESEGGR